MKFDVTVYEIHRIIVKVEADSFADAEAEVDEMFCQDELDFSNSEICGYRLCATEEGCPAPPIMY